MKEMPTLESESRLIVDSIPGIVALLSVTGEVDIANPQLLEYFGQTIDELKNWGTNGTVHPEDLPHVVEVFTRSITAGTPYDIVQRLRRADGAYRWMENKGFPLRDLNGQIMRWCVLLTDIDERKRAEETLQQNEQNLQLIIDTIPALVWGARPDGTADFFNQHYLDYVGMTSDEVMGWGWVTAVHPDDQEELKVTWQNMLSSERPGEAEARLRRHDGEYRWFLFRVNPLRDDTGRIVKWYGQNTDIEDRKRGEFRLRESERQFKTIFDEAGTGITLVDLKMGEPIRNNRALQKMLGCTEDELGRFETYDRLTDEADRERDATTFNDLCKGERESLKLEKHFVLRDGRSVWANAIFTLLREDCGKPRYVIVIHEDITERKQTLEKLQANQDLLDLAQKSAGAIAFDSYIQQEINYWSPEQEALFGLAPGTYDGTYKSWKSMIYAQDWPAVVEAIHHAHRTGVVEIEFRVVWPDGSLHWLATNGSMFFDDEGKPFRMVGFSSDVTRRKMAEVQLAGEKRLLEMVAKGQPLRDILKELCTFVEEITPDCHCGVNLIDWSVSKFQLPVTPTLPATFNDQIKDLPVEASVGPCGKAASLRTQVIVENLETDIAWVESPFRPLALAHGVRSCWSTPIYSLADHVLGTFAVYQDKPAAPTSLQQDLISQVAHIASIAIERAQHEESLRRSEAFLAESQYLARVGSFAWNVATNKITWSEQLYRMYEFEPGMPITLELIRTRVHPDDVSLYEKMKEQQQLGGEDFEWQFRLLMPDKSIKHLHAIARASSNHQCEMEYIAAVQDVTARKASEEALRRSEAELRRSNEYLTIAQELSQTGSYTRDVLTEEQILSDEMYRIWDFDTAEKVTHEMVLARIHPEDLSTFEETQRVAIPAGDDFKAAYRIVMDDGSIKHLRSSSRRFVEAKDRIVYVGATQDVTEKKLAEEALRRSEAFLAEGQHLARTGNLSWRVATNEITWSEEMYRIFEFEPGTLVTLDRIASRVHPDDMPMLYDMVERAQSGSDDFEYEHRIVMPDNSIKYLHLIAHRSGDDQHGPEYIGAVQDVTQRRLAEEALSEARSELAHAARAMSLGVLTASIAHEVSQPLSGIITNASTSVRVLDADPPNVDRAREIARRIIRDGNRASDVIARLRGLFRKKEFTTEPLDLNDAAQEVIALSRTELQKSQVVLRTELQDNLPLVDGDRVQLQQVILNLLLNAMDAMSGINDRPRQATVKTGLDKNDRVQLSVCDAGVGFASGVAEKLFDAFYTTKKSGMGIGLSVSRSIIESHHGNLWATPNDGDGATFYFSIPRATQTTSGSLNSGTDRKLT